MLRISPLLRNRVFVGAAIAGSVFAQVSLADSYVFLQLGSASSREEAEELAGVLKADFSGLLSRYGFHVREVGQVTSSRPAWRVQAGPVESKTRANRVCAEIQARGNDCFIVESAVPLSAVQTEASEAAKTAAVAERSSGVATQAGDASGQGEIYSGSIWPWNWGKAGDGERPPTLAPLKTATEASQEPSGAKKQEISEVSEPESVDGERITYDAPDASASAPKDDVLPWLQQAGGAERTSDNAVAGDEEGGQVKVAEAIPVPLSQEDRRRQAPVAPASPMQVTTQRVSLQQWSGMRRSTRWVQVGSFSDSNAALSCWNETQAHDPSVKAMRAQVLQDYAGRKSGRASLRIGPVQSDENASYICGLVKRCGGDNLSCRGIAEAVNSGQVVRPYAAGAGDVSRYADPMEKTAAAGSYWVQLGSAPTPQHARRIWEVLKGRYPELFAGRHAVVSMPAASANSAARGVYRLRTGSFKTREEASKLCATMTFRNLSCLVVAE